MAENQNQHGSPSQKSGGSDRGFGSMDDEKQRQSPSKGGATVPPQERSFSKDREHTSEAGRKGGESSGGQQGRQGSSSQAPGHGTSGQQSSSGQQNSSGQQSSSGGSGNFAQNRDKASEADRKGGQH